MFRIRINNKDKYKKYLWNTKIDNTSNILHVANLQSFVVTSRKTSSCVLISIVHDSTTVHEIRRYSSKNSRSGTLSSHTDIRSAITSSDSTILKDDDDNNIILTTYNFLYSLRQTLDLASELSDNIPYLKLK